MAHRGRTMGVGNMVNPEGSSGDAALDLSAPFWWLMAYSLETTGGERFFLYACLAQTWCSPGIRTTDTPPELSGFALRSWSRVITQQDLQPILDRLGQGMIDLSSILGVEAPTPLPVRDVRRFLVDAFGHSVVPATVHHALPHWPTAILDEQLLFSRLLSHLDGELGFSFLQGDLVRLGAFEILELRQWLDRPAPFSIEGHNGKDDRGRPNDQIVVTRSPPFVRDEHRLHLVVRNGEDLVLQKIETLTPGQFEVVIPVGGEFNDLNYSLYSADGATCWGSTRIHSVSSVAIDAYIDSGTMVRQDALTSRAKGAGGTVQRDAATVGTLTRSSQFVYRDAGKGRQAYIDRMQLAQSRHQASHTDDRWFPRSIASEVAVIQHVNHLIMSRRASGLTIVDPWFGGQALERLVTRIPMQELHVRIVASWHGIDPDTNQARNDDLVAARSILDREKPFLNPMVTLYNRVHGRSLAFHDRYLMLTTAAGPVVFLLSNSLNSIAARWPACMAELEPGVGRDVAAYIESLMIEPEPTAGQSLTMVWSSHGRSRR